MGNLVRKIYYDDASWTAPAGVTQVTVTSLPMIVQTMTPQSAGGTNFTAVDINCDAYAWGNNASGQLGNGSITVACLPSLVCCGLKWRMIGSGPSGTAGITPSGDAYAWGSNTCGGLGNGSITNQCLPTLVCCGLKWKQITGLVVSNFMLGITTSGDAYAWGNNDCGVLGNGSITVACLPTLVSCGLKWRQLGGGSCGQFSIGLTTTCDMYGWGANGAGQLGIGSISVKCLPTLVCCGIKWRSFSAGTGHILAINSTCDLYSWGQGSCGALGNNTVTNTCLPSLVCCGLKWRQVSTGVCSSFGITFDGDMYSWGTNICGRLGIGSLTAKCQPTLVCCGLKWRYVNTTGSSALAISVDGDMYSWGGNSCGVLGNGSITEKCLPTLVCCAKTWLPLINRRQKTIAVTPNTSYCIQTLARFPSFAGEVITDDVANEGLILEYLA